MHPLIPARRWPRLALALLLLLGALLVAPPAPAAAATGDAWAWGHDAYGQLGDGTIGVPDSRATPAQITGLAGAVAIAAGNYHSLALKADGTVVAWGLDASGQLGDGTIGVPDSRATPVQVAGLAGVIAIAAGNGHSLALKSDGSVWAWGNDASGQLGDGTIGPNRASPAPVAGLAGVVAIAAGWQHSLALKSDGTVVAWGLDSSGQLGDGTTSSPASRATPAQVTSLPGAVAIAAGGDHSLALATNGEVRAWGADVSGQLGDGSADAGRPFPALAMGAGLAVAIAAGSAHSLALKADGSVVAWGYDLSGQLGDGTIGSPGADPHPGPVAGLTGAVAVAAGTDFSLALKSDGTVVAWGTDFLGHLGDGTVGSPTDRATVAPVAALSGVVAIAAGRQHSLALQGAALTVQTIGSGAVARNPAGTGGGPFLYSPGTLVTLTPQPAPGWAFAGWMVDGNPAGTSPSLPLTMDASHTVVATFVLLQPLTVGGVGGGTVGRTPAGSGSNPFSYPSGTVVGLTPQPLAGRTFVGWTVDGVPQGWPNPLTITMNGPHTVQATFAPTASFPDVGSGRADFAAIIALASRGTIKGYQDGRYGPDDKVRRDQMAALIARAMPAGPGTPPTTLTPPACLVAGSWDCEVWGNNFSDGAGIDANLWRNAGTMQHYGVSIGYAGATCAAKRVPSPCFGPGDNVTYAQTISFITRAMKAKGYWVDQPGAPLPYSNVPPAHQLDVRTFHFYTSALGGVPSAPTTTVGWEAGATRGWFARALWAALDSYWKVDRVP